MEAGLCIISARSAYSTPSLGDIRLSKNIYRSVGYVSGNLVKHVDLK